MTGIHPSESELRMNSILNERIIAKARFQI